MSFANTNTGSGSTGLAAISYPVPMQLEAALLEHGNTASLNWVTVHSTEQLKRCSWSQLSAHKC